MKLLYITYVFPPIPYGGTYRALRICRGLIGKNIKCHVITLKEYSDIPNDYDLLKSVPGSVIVHRAPIIDPWRRYQAIKNKYTGKYWFVFINKIVSLMLRFITFPDHMLFWVPFAVFTAIRVIRQERIDTILVSSPPDSSQLIGWVLKKWKKVRWIADFRDPIYGNVAQVSIINPDNFSDKLHKKVLNKYDRFVCSTADVLIANTENHAAQLRSRHGRTNVHVIRNAYDLEELSNSKNDKYGVLTISHVGSIYGNRNPDLLFSAIRQLTSEYMPETLQLQILFIGLGGGTLRESIKRFEIDEYVKIIEQVAHHSAIEYMCRSHLLLLIKATGKWSQGQIPGKFFEYVGSHNPVLCIGPKNSEVATLIKEGNLGYVVEDDLAEMVSILRIIYAQYLESGNLHMLSEAQVTPFSSTEMVDKIYQIIEQA